MSTEQPPALIDETAAPLPADLQDERLIGGRGLQGGFAATVSRLRTGDLGSAPVIIGLIIIWGVFQILRPEFLSSTNLVNLSLDMAAIGTTALGVVLVLLLGEIDLSVGSMAGLSGAVLAVAYVSHGWPWWAAVLASLATGVAVGAFYGFLYNRFGVPAFVITLAGLLAFLGLQLLVLGKLGTINFPYDRAFFKFANLSFLPKWLSYVLVLIAVAGFLAARIRMSRQRSAAGLSTTPMAVIGLRSGLLLLGLLVAVFVLNRDRGVSYMVLMFLLLVLVMDFAIRRTRWGRSVMAVGGNVEAARRSGINVTRVYLSVFALCSTFAALGGIFFAARLGAANQSSGTGDYNLNAIASAVIGGTSLFGGRGSAYSAVLGILVIQSISSGLNLLNLDSSIRYMVTGAVLLIAVTVDSLSRRSRAAHGRA